jgi:heme-degrading monooxygenase HmoA
LTPERSTLDLVQLPPSITDPSCWIEERPMEHIRIVTYEVEDGTLESLIEIVHQELRRTYEAQPGFLRQTLVRLQGLRFLSLTVWETKQQANEGLVTAEAWGRGADSGAADFRLMPVRPGKRSRLTEAVIADVPAAI